MMALKATTFACVCLGAYAAAIKHDIDAAVMQADVKVASEDRAETGQLSIAETCLGDVSVMQLDLVGLMARKMHIKSQYKKEADGAKVTKEHEQASKKDKAQEVDAPTGESHQAQNPSKQMLINRQFPQNVDDLLPESSQAYPMADRALAENSPGRILLYVTSAGSEQHLTYLECQADVLSKTMTLGMADVLMYVGESTPSSKETRDMYSKLLDRWTSGRKSIYYDTNPGYQLGAMKAAHVGFSSGWFDGYDWVIRINPDVVVYDERNLVNLMREPRNTGIFVKCVWDEERKLQKQQIHTDFFAVRPGSVERMAFSGWNQSENAEIQAAGAFHPIIENGSYAELVDRGGNGHCRVDGGGVYHSTVNCPELLADPPWMADTNRSTDGIHWREAWAQH